MASTFDAQPPATTPEVGGMGHSASASRTPRFIRGKGTYIEDVNLPGQLWLDIVRSPHARHQVDRQRRSAQVPGVAAVITGKDLEGYNSHWMPTLAGDKQAVLPVDTVLFQSQEVAAVIATDRYAAADGSRPCSSTTSRCRSSSIRSRHSNRRAPPYRARIKQNNHIWHWESGDKRGDRRGARGVRVARRRAHLPAAHPRASETCGMVADWDAVNGHLTLHITSQAPHVIGRSSRSSPAPPAADPGAEHPGQDPTSAVGSAARSRPIRLSSQPRPRS